MGSPITEDLIFTFLFCRHLNGNGMTSLQGNIFANSSVISDSLYLHNNNLSSIPINAFDNLSVRRV